jgi:CheY-like chemotaxis protein
VLRIVEEATREPIDNPVDAVLRNRIGLRLDYRGLLVARDGTETAIEGSASPMRNDRGVVVGVALSLRTITTRQHTAAGGLRAAAPPRDEFLATLAHELRNPLAAIRNALELMRVHGDATGPHEIIRRQVAQMARLVDDQIDVADPSKDPTEPPQPLALAPARPCPVPPDSGAAANGGLRVVVVDDNEDAAASLGTLLELWGYNVRTEHEGAHAVQAAVEFDPDVVLLDIGLPGLDGYTVARRMRAHRALEHVFLVAITGWGQPEDRRRSHEAGFDRHLVKPVDLDALRGLLASVDSERSQHAATLIHGGPAT